MKNNIKNSRFTLVHRGLQVYPGAPGPALDNGSGYDGVIYYRFFENDVDE